MLEVQKYLHSYGLGSLPQDYKIGITKHPSLPMAILTYDALEAHKAKMSWHPIVRECRSLVIELGTWEVISKSFTRFPNLGEYDDGQFNWSNYRIEEKVDGSLINLYCYNGWKIRTSSSFGEGIIMPGLPHTWSSLFWDLFPKEIVPDLNPNVTYTFELCSPYNVVVKRHDRPHLKFLSSFNNKSFAENSLSYNCVIADVLNIPRPTLYPFSSIEEGLKWLETQPANFEGFVLVDDRGHRIKVKNAAYLALHRLKNNGTGFLPRNLVPLILTKPEEKSEILTYFPEIKKEWERCENYINSTIKSADIVLNDLKTLNKKEFALAIAHHEYALKSILFTCRNKNWIPSQHVLDFVDLFVKTLEEK